MEKSGSQNPKAKFELADKVEQPADANATEIRPALDTRDRGDPREDSG
jgi:hypothetical protein